MIDLYIATNTNYDKNGNMELLPTSCMVSAEINGSWSLEMTHPIDEEGRWSLITEGNVLKVRSFNGVQLFRIKQVTKQDSGIKALAEPIFLDAMGDCFLMDVRPTNATGGAALSSILSPNSKYSGTSNISTRSTAYYYLKNAMEAIAGDEENSFLSRWGGEIEYNNYQIIINNRLGADNGVEILYGKNIPVDGLIETVNISDVVTRVIPKAFNGRLITTATKYVNSPLINNYPTIVTKVIEYPHIKMQEDLQGDASPDDIICTTNAQLNTALRNAANKEFSENDIDKPKISISCDMILLQNTDEYAEFKDFETVSLGDTIHCNHSRLGIVSDARIVELEWNCLTESVDNVTIGSAIPNYLNRVAATVQRTEKAITPEGDVIASQISGFIDGARTQLRIQNSQAVRQDAIAILFEDTDTQSATFGALALGTQGLQVSRTRVNGEWDWGTAITSEGIIANYVVAGILSDKNAINYWNLDTGEFRLSSTATVGGQTVQEIATTAANGAVDAQTQEFVFNKLTNNGALQGIYMSDGQLYINGTYIKAGTIDANLIKAGIIKDTQNKNYWNLGTGEFSLSSTATVGGSTVQSIADTSSAAAVAAQTQTDIFNKLTNNGALQGIYMQNGELYVNGTYIKAGIIDANLIKAGIIKDTQNKNYWNLATGEFSLSATTTVGGSTVQSIANNAASSAVAAQTQTDIFNKLTNNGALQGIYMQNGELYINGTYIKAGTIDANLIKAGIIKDTQNKNYWNLATGDFSLSATTTVGGSTVQNIADTSSAAALASAQTYADGAAASAVAAQTQQDIFNKLTNNGALQGIYMQGGQLYVNGTYIKSGVIDANLITAGIIKDAANKNSWNLTTGALSTSGAVVSGGSITGATINNGSGTFQVDTNGNLKATSAEITGDIKSGSTITGSTITGSVITTAGTRTDDPVSPGTTFNYTSSLENGNIVFTRTGVGTSTYDGTITIQGGGITSDFDTAAMVATMSNVFRVQHKTNADQYATLGLGSLRIQSSTGNYINITPSNIEIYRNGTRVWSAL